MRLIAILALLVLATFAFRTIHHHDHHQIIDLDEYIMPENQENHESFCEDPGDPEVCPWEIIFCLQFSDLELSDCEYNYDRYMMFLEMQDVLESAFRNQYAPWWPENDEGIDEMCSWAEEQFPDHHMDNHLCHLDGVDDIGAFDLDQPEPGNYGSLLFDEMSSTSTDESLSNDDRYDVYDEDLCYDEPGHPTDGTHYCDTEYECLEWCYNDFEICHGWAKKHEEECEYAFGELR